MDSNAILYLNLCKRLCILKKYKHLFFDLDHTLWDFAKNSKQTLKEAFLHFNLKDFNINFEDFLAEYFKINDAYWDDYRKGRVTKEQLRYGRFRQSLKHFNIVDEALIIKFADFYVEHSPQKKNVFPNTHETLDFLKNHYELHIITNGFEEVQYIKLEKSNLAKYFKHIITSEKAGVKKPNQKIFHFSMKLAGANNANSLMIVDNFEADIIGAKKVGIDQVFFNPDKQPVPEKVTYEIENLKQLIGLLS